MDAGLGVTHTNGSSGDRYLPEVMGAGAALFDADGDGDLDVWLVDGHSLPTRKADDPSDRLMRNLLMERGELRFEDATAEFGIRATGYGMGVAVGDVNQDGFPDVYLAQLGVDQLWLNVAGERFEDHTVAAGLDDDGVWSTSASFVDFDQDGHLDLYVANYVDFTFGNHQDCKSPAGRKDYCSPRIYRPLADRVYRNRGDGTFDDVTSRSGVGQESANGLGAVSGDFDGDGSVELYVANDMMPNFLWDVTPDWNFENRGLVSGSAVNRQGKAEGSMGIATGDVNGDGREDLLVTHLVLETHTLYVADEIGGFEDRTQAFDLTGSTFQATGFGAAFADFDLDGRLDLVVANGAVTEIETLVAAGDSYPLGQANQLFRFVPTSSGGRFVESPELIDPSFAALEVSRGLAVGDVDENGTPDVLITNNSGMPRLYVNQHHPAREHWLGLTVLEGRDMAIGARVSLVTADGRRQTRVVRRDGSYASSNDPRILFGFVGTSPETLEVQWLDGHTLTIEAPPTGRYLAVDRDGLVSGPSAVEEPDSVP